MEQPCLGTLSHVNSSGQCHRGTWGSFSAGLVGPKKQQQLKALPKSRDETGPVHHWGQD